MKRSKIIAIIFISFMLGSVVITSMATITIDNTGIFDTTTLVKYTVKEAEWIVYTDNIKYYGINGSTGKCEFTRNTYLTDGDDIINDCIDELKNGVGGKVLVKAGTYHQDDTIHLYRSFTSWTEITLQGGGMGVTNFIMKVGSEKNCIDFVVNDVNNDGFKKISDLNFYGDPAGTLGHGFFSDETAAGGEFDIIIDQCMFYGMAQDGIHIEDGWGVKITDCITETNEHNGTFIYGVQCYVDNLFTAYNGMNGIYNVGNFNKFVNVESMGNDRNGIHIQSSQHCTFSNIDIGNWGAANYAGLNLEGAVNNVFSSISIDGQASVTADYGLFCQSTSHNNTFYSIHIVDVDSKSLYVTSTSRDNMIYGTFGTKTQDISVSARCVINGVSLNAGVPGTAGAWLSPALTGALVWNTLTSKMYVYCNATWNILN